jgi:YVTN family beta-propeller protein
MATDSRVGSEVAGYRIESVLGRGGMGVVYVARHLRLDRTVALKVVSPDLAEDPKFRDRFVRESQLAASLEHPNIVPIHDAGEEGGVLYLAMRLVSGTDLKRLIEGSDGGLDPARALKLLDQVAGALDSAHQAGLVHRDVKPGNVLIGSPETASEHAYLSDFGLTKRMTSDSGLTGTGQFVGTLDYAAPEQFEGKKLDGRADVYSLAVVLYESLSGEIPYRRDNQAALVYAHLMAEPPAVTEKRPELPAAIDAVVAKGMAKSPEDRYPTAGALVADATDALGEQASATAGRTSPPLTVPASPPTRRPTLTPLRMAVAGLLVIAAVVGAVALFSGGGGKGKATQSMSGAAPAAALGDRVVRIDTANKKILTSIPVGKSPSGVAVGEGSVWVASSDEGVVYRIDPVSNKVIAKIAVGKRPSAIAFGNGAIWVANRLSNSVSEIDPGNNRAVTIPGVDQPQSIAAGDGAVFVGWSGAAVPGGPGGGVSIIDPGTMAVIKTIGASTFCTAFVAEGAGAAWAGGTSGVVKEIDPATGAVGRTINLGTNVFGLTVGEGSVWVASGGLPATISRLNPDSGKVEATIPVGRSVMHGACFTPISLTATQGFVWVTNAGDGTVSQIATVANQVVNAYDVGKTPTGVAVGFGSAWVTVEAP